MIPWDTSAGIQVLRISCEVRLVKPYIYQRIYLYLLIRPHHTSHHRDAVELLARGRRNGLLCAGRGFCKDSAWEHVAKVPILVNTSHNVTEMLL